MYEFGTQPCQLLDQFLRNCEVRMLPSLILSFRLVPLSINCRFRAMATTLWAEMAIRLGQVYTRRESVSVIWGVLVWSVPWVGPLMAGIVVGTGRSQSQPKISKFASTMYRSVYPPGGLLGT